SCLPALYRFAASRLRGDRELIREIVQTTVCKALAGLGDFRGEAAFFTWLCACCRNEIAMHYRRQQTIRREVPLPDEREPSPAAGTPQPEGITESLLREERARFVHIALDLLPPHHARALSMKYLENASVKQIASALGMAPKAAESLLTRARIAFRGHYDRLTQDFEPSAMASAAPWGSKDHV
ncbi:MAG: sigma-70 family RNA polymerase sigma factor, partial [Thermoanaerobaculia bacterium]